MDPEPQSTPRQVEPPSGEPLFRCFPAALDSVAEAGLQGFWRKALCQSPLKGSRERGAVGCPINHICGRGFDLRYGFLCRGFPVLRASAEGVAEGIQNAPFRLRRRLGLRAGGLSPHAVAVARFSLWVCGIVHNSDRLIIDLVCTATTLWSANSKRPVQRRRDIVIQTHWTEAIASFSAPEMRRLTSPATSRAETSQRVVYRRQKAALSSSPLPGNCRSRQESLCSAGWRGRTWSGPFGCG